MNINILPFHARQLRVRLGSPNPWLIDIAKEPLPFRQFRFSRNTDPTKARILISDHSIPSYEKTSARSERLSTKFSYENLFSIGNLLSPVHFQGSKPRQVSCYAFFKGWLLLSLPPCCLRFKTLFDTISKYLRTLTEVSLDRVSDYNLTPQPCFLFYYLQVLSWKKHRIRKDLRTKSVTLPRK